MSGRPLTEDEWLVLLDYFFRSPEPTHTDSHPACQDLAHRLGRPPSTVDFSLRNLKNIDTRSSGMSHAASTARRLYSEYVNRREHLRHSAARVLVRIEQSRLSPSEQALARLHRFNARNRHRQASVRRHTANVFDRPSKARSDLIQLVGTDCQLCGSEGFEMAGGGRYAEAHHIEHLASRTIGNLCTDNVLVVCPTCHAKLHHANVEVVSGDGASVNLVINGVEYTAQRNSEDRLGRLVNP